MRKDDDGGGDDDVLLSSVAVHAFVPEVRFVIATIVVAIMEEVTVCSGDATNEVDVLVLVAKLRRVV